MREPLPRRPPRLRRRRCQGRRSPTPWPPPSAVAVVVVEEAAWRWWRGGVLYFVVVLHYGRLIVKAVVLNGARARRRRSARRSCRRDWCCRVSWRQELPHHRRNWFPGKRCLYMRALFCFFVCVLLWIKPQIILASSPLLHIYFFSLCLLSVLIEKILRTNPDVGKIYVLIKAKDGEAALRRLQNEVRCACMAFLLATHTASFFLSSP